VGGFPSFHAQDNGSAAVSAATQHRHERGLEMPWLVGGETRVDRDGERTLNDNYRDPRLLVRRSNFVRSPLL